MSFELKRSHSPSESSHLASTKKPRSAQLEGEGDSEGEDHPASAALSSSAEPKATPQSSIENPQHPSELTTEQYQFCLMIMNTMFEGTSDVSATMKIALTAISGFKPGGCRDPNDAEILLQRDPELRKNLERRDFEKVLNSRIIWQDKQEDSSKPNTTSPPPLGPAMQEVVSAAWQSPYKGSGNVLEDVLQQYLLPEQNEKRYARYASITQSSGSGKSRMVDELAKTIFCIPMCLGSDQAYPPSDSQLRSWFASIGGLEDDMRTVHVQLLMCSLFETALERAKLIASDPALQGESVASRFRQLMSEGMVYGQHGLYRQEFYADFDIPASTQLTLLPKGSVAIRQSSPTPEVSAMDEKGRQIYVKAAAEALTSYLTTVQKESSTARALDLEVILYFDEAQLLTTRGTGKSGIALFPDVRRALRLVRELPIFALFLSTVGKLEQFSPPPQLESSARLFRSQLVPYPPIVWTPFDVMAARITNEKVWTLTEVASTYHIVHLGRPLFPAMYDAALAQGDKMVSNWIIRFACQKLLKTEPPAKLSNQQALACIAVRIPIEFSAAPLLLPDEEDTDLERDFVADHMRLLLYAGLGFSPIITTSPSEPLLAEAASSLMIARRWSKGKAVQSARRLGLDPVVAATFYFGKSLLDLGERGEFAAALLLLYARDCATTFSLRPPYPGTSSGGHDADDKYDGAHQRRIVTVHHFLEALLGEERFKTCAHSVPGVYHTPEYANTPLSTAIQDGFIYFNHFIKVQSFDLVNQQYLVLAISRGAAIICADRHVGIDIVVPVLVGTELKKEKVTAILVQHGSLHVRPV
ncbi:hypothetical protein FKP32DRAFT_1670559 [Trametes sanguinea]|nr:hypothetical protein FKP32DRAFT_1670559 [Trametes sanguinea]